jgi:hypothetical protein
MDHRLIEDENIAELYATGRLSPEDEEELEIHLLECRECRARVAQVDDFRDSLRTVAAEDAARATVQLGLLGWLARQSRSARLGLLTAALLVLVALPTWLLIERVRLERELADARKAAEHPISPETRDPAPLPAPSADTRELARLAQEQSRLQEELRQERTAREALADRIARLAQPQVNTAVYSLGLVRGESKIPEIDLGSASAWIVLSLDLPLTGHDTYRATLLDARGNAGWQGDGLRPTASDTLTLLFPSGLLKPGDYRLRLEAVDAGGRAVPAGEIPFRVRRD